MSTNPRYNTGTISISHNATSVVGVGTAWDDLSNNDLILFVPSAGYAVLISAVVDDTHLTIPSWAPSTVSGVGYEILVLPNGTLANAQDLVNYRAKLAQAGVFHVVAAGADPDPSIGKDGDFAIRIAAGQFTFWEKASGAWSVTGSIFSNARESLSGDRSYYVRLDGSDSNTGLVDSSGGAFLTRQKAVDAILNNVDTQGHTCYIVCRSGTHTSPVSISRKPVGGGIIYFLGDQATPSNVLISTTSNSAFSIGGGAGPIYIDGFKIQTTTSGSAISVNGGGCDVNGLNLIFGACAGSRIQLDFGGKFQYVGNATVIGNAPSMVHFTNLAQFYAASGVWTMSGTPAHSNFFIGGSENATAKWEGVTFSGSATGQRFFVHTSAEINIGGTGNLTYFPGDSAGLYSEGGVYDIFVGSTSFNSIVIQKFTTSGTYTPTTGMKYCQIECLGGGGGGGGVLVNGANVLASAGGGGAGGYSRAIKTAAQIGASQTVTIGAAGAAGAATPTNGGAGGDTSVGTLCIGKGASGGLHNSAGNQAAVGGAGGIAGTGDITATGSPGGSAPLAESGFNAWLAGGAGGSCLYGGGGLSPIALNAAVAGNVGTGNGSGGSGAAGGNATGTAAGGAGTAGLVFITEYLNAVGI